MNDFVDRTQPIPRNVPLPQGLSDEELQHIEDTVFFPHNPQQSDVLFVFGYSGEEWNHVGKLMKMNMAPIALVTGKHTKESPADKAQAHAIRDAVLLHGIESNRILVEDESTNTVENVVFGKKILDEANITPRSILFACKSHHSGRCARTLRRHFPQVHLYNFSVDAKYKGVPVQKNTWKQHAVSQQRVYGEFLRIQMYAQKGDIAPAP